MTETTTTGAAAGVLRALSDELAGAVAAAGRAVVAIHARRRIPASGLAWREDAILAASHTIRREEGITVTLDDGRTLPARLAGRDPGADLALLRLEEPALAPFAPAPDEALRVGALVLAVGRPGPAVTTSLGVVSAVGGEWRTWSGGRIERMVRLDLAIHDGFSGGALVGADGRVLGLNTSGLARGAAMTVPVSTLERIGAHLLRDGRIARGWLGVGVQPVRLPEQVTTRLGIVGSVALLLVAVEDDGPAGAAGMHVGDVVVAVDGERVRDPGELVARLGPESVGQAVELQLLRGGQLRTQRLTVAERPARDRGRRGR